MGIFRPFNPFCTGVKEFHSFPVHSKLHFALTQEFTRASQRSNSTRSSGTHRAPWRMQRISVACGRQLHSIASIFNGSKRKSQRAAEKRSRENENESGEGDAEHISLVGLVLHSTHFPSVFLPSAVTPLAVAYFSVLLLLAFVY